MNGYFEQMKRRGIKPEVNWWRDRWRKKIKGKTNYFAHPNTKDGYSQAVAEMHAYKLSLKPTRELEKEYRHRLAILQTMVTWYQRYGCPEDEFGVDIELRKFVTEMEFELTQKELRPLLHLFPDGVTLAEKKFLRQFNDSFIKINPYYPWEPLPQWAERIRQIENSVKKPMNQNVGHWSEVLKADWELKLSTNKLQSRTVDDYTEKLDYFIGLIGSKTPVEELQKGPLNFLYSTLSDKIVAKKMKGRRANNITRTARRFVKFCWRQDHCLLETLPKAIDDPDLLFFNDDSEVDSDDLWEHEDLVALLMNCPVRYQAVVLLGLNCGFRNTDCSKLTILGKSKTAKRKKYGVDLNTGRLIWRRPKTERFKPPTVNYRLWDLTIELLNAARGDDVEFWFSSNTGGRLVYRGADLLANGWKNLNQKPKKKLESCRDTGATLLSDVLKFKSARLDQLFLGQVCTIADKHYNAHDGKVYPPMDKALAYMEKKLGIKKLKLPCK